MPQGFSHRIGRPAAASCVTSCRCSVLGAAISTPSSPPARNIASASAMDGDIGIMQRAT